MINEKIEPMYNNSVRFERILIKPKEGEEPVILSKCEGIIKAKGEECDLIEISVDTKREISICVIEKLSKYLFKKSKEKTNKQKKVKKSIVSLNINIGKNDLKRKLSSIASFLTCGGNVEVVLRKRRLRDNVTDDTLQNICTSIKEIIKEGGVRVDMVKTFSNERSKNIKFQIKKIKC